MQQLFNNYNFCCIPCGNFALCLCYFEVWSHILGSINRSRQNLVLQKDVSKKYPMLIKIISLILEMGVKFAVRGPHAFRGEHFCGLSIIWGRSIEVNRILLFQKDMSKECSTLIKIISLILGVSVKFANYFKFKLFVLNIQKPLK